MPAKITWSPEADATILHHHRIGTTWDRIAALVGVSRNTAMTRGAQLDRNPALRPSDALIQAAANRAAARVALEQLTYRAPPAPRIANRDPFPAGHPITWQLLTDGTGLAGAPYPERVFV
jgi:hypothetical protein